MLLAIISKYTKVKLDSSDVYLNIARWLRIEEPSIDLSLAWAIISSKQNHAIPRDSIFIWEISLTWSIKNVLHLEKRIKEAEKLWFKKIYIPNSEIKWDFKIEIIKVTNIWEFAEKI